MKTAVFLTGFWRSGTNMVVSALNKNDDIALYNENNPKAFENWLIKDLDLIKDICIKENHKISLFKPVSEPYRISEFLNLGIESKVIYLYRRPESVSKSALQRFPHWPKSYSKFIKNFLDGKDPYSKYNSQIADQIRKWVKTKYTDTLNDASLIVLRWLISNEFYFKCNFKLHPKVFTASYEEITTNPTDCLKRICNFLAIDFNSKISENISTSNRHKFDIIINDELMEIANNCYEKLDEIKVKEDDVWTYKKLGESLEKKSQKQYLTEAIANYRKAISLNPKDMSYLEARVEKLLLKVKDLDKEEFQAKDRNVYWQSRKDDVMYQMIKNLAHAYASEGVSVLDVGCHNSSLILDLDWFTKKVVTDRPYITKYWQKVKGVEFIPGDFNKLKFDRTFDLVLCTQGIEHLQEPKPFIQKLLSLGKTVIVSTTYEVPEGICKYHVQDPISFEKFQSWFDTEFTATVIIRRPKSKVWRNIIGVVT